MLTLKIHLENTYDILDWTYVKLTLQNFGFLHYFIGLIMNYVTKNLVILWNGTKTHMFKPNRGMWLRNSVSPYIFVLHIKKLVMHIQEKMENRS